MSIPVFNGEVEYHSYDQLVNKITNFNNYDVIGIDESGQYDIHKIEIGNPSNPTIMITTGVHGNEWQTVIYTIAMMETLENGTFPDTDLMNDLLNNFHIVYIPMVNPWGVDNVSDIYGRLVGTGRRNSNDIDLNRDLINQSENETKVFMKIFNQYKPFAYLDSHMYQPFYNLAEGNNLIVGKGNSQSTEYQRNIQYNTEIRTGETTTLWGLINNTGRMFIGYAGEQSNAHTPFTFSIISEMERPAYRDDNDKTDIVRELTNSEIFDYGSVMTYLFLSEAIRFFNVYNIGESQSVKQVITPTATFELTRNGQGHLLKSIEHKNDGRVIETTPVRNSDGFLESINKEEI